MTWRIIKCRDQLHQRMYLPVINPMDTVQICYMQLASINYPDAFLRPEQTPKRVFFGFIRQKSFKIHVRRVSHFGILIYQYHPMPCHFSFAYMRPVLTVDVTILGLFRILACFPFRRRGTKRAVGQARSTASARRPILRPGIPMWKEGGQCRAAWCRKQGRIAESPLYQENGQRFSMIPYQA